MDRVGFNVLFLLLPRYAGRLRHLDSALNHPGNIDPSGTVGLGNPKVDCQRNAHESVLCRRAEKPD